jgi:hypothetical protein
MTVDHDKPEADVAEQAEPAEGNSAEEYLLLPDTNDPRPVADTLEQSIPVREFQAVAPMGSRAEVSEADWIEQSIEVPLDEDEAHR